MLIEIISAIVCGAALIGLMSIMFYEFRKALSDMPYDEDDYETDP